MKNFFSILALFVNGAKGAVLNNTTIIGQVEPDKIFYKKYLPLRPYFIYNIHR